MSSLSLSQLSLLLVEPSDVQRKVIYQYLTNAGITLLETASTIQEAKEKLLQQQPDLVVSSMYFPDGESIELLHYLFEQSSLADTLFMLVSSEHKREQLEAFRQAGCIAILPKPFTTEHLQHAVQTTIDIMSPDEFHLDIYDVEDLRVLLIDDSPFSRSHLRRIFEGLGITQITEAEHGLQAIDILQHEQSQFDLICTDYHMPEMDGKELAESIRQFPQLQYTPILMVSARADELQLAQIKQAGINALTKKPFDPHTLKASLKQLLN